MTTSPSRASPPLFSTLASDVRSVAADVQRRGVRRSVSGTLASLEGFYLTDEDRRQLAAMRRLRRLVYRLLWLIRSLLLKLTPARRILLALSILFVVVGGQRIELDADSFLVSVRLPLLSSVLLFTVLMLELKDKLVARDELEAGRRVQLALMPDQSPEIPGWQVWLYTAPANDVGGDLVDHLPIDAGRHAVALGDVAGKALPAALLSVKLQATLRALAPLVDDLGDLGAGLNRILHRDGLPTRFASLVYIVLSPDSSEVRVLNAGHMPPLLVRGDVITPMERGGMVLGIAPDMSFSEQRADVNAGDTLVVYSDGITEAMNEAGDFFGDDRLHDALRQAGALSPAEIGARILAAVAHFIGDAVPSDDVSLMVLRRRPASRVAAP